jgi:methylenetetrahydrofolate--tRNA-(uracil-5-)-methyltransferase
MNKINIIGGGLAGSEAALQFSKKGWKVNLFEMRPTQMTEAHKTGNLSEIVCSNSFKSKLMGTSSGVLKAEMNLLGCELLKIAEETAVPAGNALAVDRDKFSQKVTDIISKDKNITVINDEIKEIDDSLTILATGPLTSPSLTEYISNILGKEQLYFFDAIAPIVSADSLNYDIIFRKSRYDKGEADYLNCPFSKEEYYRFVDALNSGEKHEAKEFETKLFKEINFNFYENCTPIEELARRGKDTLRYGVMRPVGLIDPRIGKRAFAVLQLRTENNDKSYYNLVGCQTMLKYGEQKDIFRLIPGMEKAEFYRYGSIHRNTYLNSPQIINPNMSFKKKENLFVAGQIAGVEGYTESIFSGLLTAKIIIENLPMLPETTISGQLWRHLITPSKNFQPMNSNFGLLPEIKMEKKNKRLKKELLGQRSVQSLTEFLKNL